MGKLLVFVGFGGFVGSVLRYVASGFVQQLTQNANFS
jgi:fluoride ion exporter CrcB/FEX